MRVLNALKEFFKDLKENLLLSFILLVYFVSAIISVVFIDSVFANVMIPIVLYNLYNIIIRQFCVGDVERRFTDLNDMAIVSFGISYMLYFFFKDKYLFKVLEFDLYMKGHVFVLLILIFMMLLILFILFFSKATWWNNKKE